MHDGAFVWADSTDSDFNSSAKDEFAVRATGGMRVVLAVDAISGAPTWTCSASNGNGWACSSDRDLKEHFRPVNVDGVLQAIDRLPIFYWNAKGVSVDHIGPTAQDFRSAFQVGSSDKMIGMQDADGVALAAIEGLRQLLRDKDQQIADLKDRLDAIESRLGLH